MSVLRERQLNVLFVTNFKPRDMVCTANYQLNVRRFVQNTVTCRGVCVTKIMGYRSDDWIY
jgi:hypothetical protein